MAGVMGLAFLTRCCSRRFNPEMHWSSGPYEDGVAPVRPIFLCIVRTALKYILMLLGDLRPRTTYNQMANQHSCSPEMGRKWMSASSANSLKALAWELRARRVLRAQA